MEYMTRLVIAPDGRLVGPYRARQGTEGYVEIFSAGTWWIYDPNLLVLPDKQDSCFETDEEVLVYLKDRMLWVYGKATGTAVRTRDGIREGVLLYTDSRLYAEARGDIRWLDREKTVRRYEYEDIQTDGAEKSGG